MTNAEHARFLEEWGRGFIEAVRQLDATLQRLEALLKQEAPPWTGD